jgi:hypothetical protein
MDRESLAALTSRVPPRDFLKSNRVRSSLNRINNLPRIDSARAPELTENENALSEKDVAYDAGRTECPSSQSN